MEKIIRARRACGIFSRSLACAEHDLFKSVVMGTPASESRLTKNHSHCREALLTRLYDVDSKCPQVDKVLEHYSLEHYRKFDLMASKRLEEKIKINNRLKNG